MKVNHLQFNREVLSSKFYFLTSCEESLLFRSSRMNSMSGRIVLSPLAILSPQLEIQ